MSMEVPPIGAVEAYAEADRLGISVEDAILNKCSRGYTYWGTFGSNGGEYYLPPSPIKVLLVGRHAADAIPGVSVEETLSVTWPIDGDSAALELSRIAAEQEALGRAVLLQAVPGALAIGLARLQKQLGEGFPGDPSPKIGVVVSKAAPRPAAVVNEYGFDDPYSADTLVAAVKTANPNARIERVSALNVRVTVDPPMRFEFDHIEWM